MFKIGDRVFSEASGNGEILSFCGDDIRVKFKGDNLSLYYYNGEGECYGFFDDNEYSIKLVDNAPTLEQRILKLEEIVAELTKRSL